MFTGAEIKHLGKRLREEDYDRDDIESVDALRGWCDTFLLHVNTVVIQALQASGIRAVVAGRSKRVKSIVRKLRRPANRGMDLSRMADIVGLRVVVKDTADQDTAIQAIRQAFPAARITDYRSRDKLYRAVHVTVKSDDDFRLVEIQIRTLVQQVWANESESFGEQVKEGEGPPEVQDYLVELSGACRVIDEGGEPNPGAASRLFAERAPLTMRIPLLAKAFARATVPDARRADGSYIVIFDTETNTCLQKHFYAASERATALEDYKASCGRLDDTRYELLVLNSSSDASLAVSHPRFFPEGE